MDPNLYAASIGAPAAPENTLGASQYNEISNMGAIGRKLPVSTGLANESVNVAQQQVEEQKRAAAAAASAAKSGGASGAGGKYTIKPRKDGGYGFYGPDGSEISASDYARATNKDLGTVLKNSQNPIDKGFVEDWKNLNNYIKLKQANDPKAKQIETQVKNQYGVDLHKQQIGDVINTFMQAYPTVFGGTNTGVPVGKQFIPAAQTSKKGSSSPSSNIRLSLPKGY